VAAAPPAPWRHRHETPPTPLAQGASTPRALEAVGAIPKSPTGKILRRVLVAQERARARTP
jgi:acyl-CoA synthetase (AMP-forming)/AMP-acid ligase II